MTSLDPTMNIGDQIMEGMIWHYKTPKQEAYQKAVQLLELVGITDAEKRMKNFPHQLSGGMRQRVVIAIALACDPDLLICDEPTTALDVTIQARILELIKEIQAKMGISVIYITHDLGVVAKVADYVNVSMPARLWKRAASTIFSMIPATRIPGACFRQCRISTPKTTGFTLSPVRPPTCCTKCLVMLLHPAIFLR